MKHPTIIMKDGSPRAWHEDGFYPLIAVLPTLTIAKNGVNYAWCEDGFYEIVPSAAPAPAPAPAAAPVAPVARAAPPRGYDADDAKTAPAAPASVDAAPHRVAHGHGPKHIGSRENSLAERIRCFVAIYGVDNGIDRDLVISAMNAENPNWTRKKVMQAAAQLSSKKQLTVYPVGKRNKQTYLPTNLTKKKVTAEPAARATTEKMLAPSQGWCIHTPLEKYRAVDKKQPPGAWANHLRVVCPPSEVMDILPLIKGYNDTHGLWKTIHAIKVCHCEWLPRDEFVVDIKNMTLMYVPKP